ncbi:MAG: toprim domain-containing protein [Synechococcaceae cyanobacterium SM1_2_3]|nr:toprim domain-containing protein [Synechococcaceae cyanobacterium SM1_2_3]
MDRVIGFGGRRLDDKDEMAAKYINSPETPLYKKGRSLYALNVAQKAIGKEGYAILTEGYMDTLMAHRFGFEQAVASLGTGLTPEQARLIKRYAGRVYFLYDSDEAGLKAMQREGEPLLATGLDTRIILLPEGDQIQCEGATNHFLGTSGMRHGWMKVDEVEPKRAKVDGAISAALLVDRAFYEKAGVLIRCCISITKTSSSACGSRCLAGRSSANPTSSYSMTAAPARRD